MEHPTGQCQAINIQNLAEPTRCLHQTSSSSKGGRYCSEHAYSYRLEKDDCAVCLEEIDDRLEEPLACGHWFHLACLREWGHDSCPTCRVPVAHNDALRISFAMCETDDQRLSDYMAEIFDWVLEGHRASIHMPDDDFEIRMETILNTS